MGLLDAYVTAEEYEGHSTKGRPITDTVLDGDLVMASRLVDHVLGLTPGAFNSAQGTRHFSGHGKPRLYLADGDGQHFLQSVAEDGIAVDTDGDGEADCTVDLTSAPWIVGYPRNAAAFGKPYDALEIVPRSGVPLNAWPQGTFNVSITGTWGWTAVPEGIKALVVVTVRDMRTRQNAGPTMDLEMAGSTVSISRGLWYRIRELRSEYAYRGPRVA